MFLRSALLVGAIGLSLYALPASFSASAQPHTAASTASLASAGIEPGGYHSVITFSNVTGLPPRLAQSMMSHPHETDGCVHTGDINKLVQDAIAGAGNMTCSQNQASAVGGVINGSAACQDDEGISGTLQFTGSYTATHVDVNADLTAQTPIGPIAEHIHLVSDHTGAVCKSDN